MTESLTPHADVWAAIAAVQAKLPAIAKSAEGAIPVGESKLRAFKYADMGAIWAQVRPLTAKHGIALRFELVLEHWRSAEERKDLGDFTMVLWVYHPASKTGFDSRMPVWPRMSGMQGLAAAATYARRYCLLHALCIITEDEPELDNDHAEPAPRRGARAAFDRGIERVAAAGEAASEAERARAAESLAKMPPAAQPDPDPQISKANASAIAALAVKRAKEFNDESITKDVILSEMRKHFGVESLLDLRCSRLNEAVRFARTWSIPDPSQVAADEKF